MRFSRVFMRIPTSFSGVPAAKSFRVTLIRYLAAYSLGESMLVTARSLSVFTDLARPKDFFMLPMNLLSYVIMLELAVKRRVIS